MAFGFFEEDNGSVNLGDIATESKLLVLSLQPGELRHAPDIAGDILNLAGDEARTRRLIAVEDAFLSDGAESASVTASPSIIQPGENIISADVKYP